MPCSTSGPAISESHPKEDRLHPSIEMSANPINSERVFAEAARKHWRQLGEELRADVDEFNRTVDGKSAGVGVAEGGILSMRLGPNGVEFYSSDQPLTAPEARSLLLDPVLSSPGGVT